MYNPRSCRNRGSSFFIACAANFSLSGRWITYTLLASLFEGGGCANAQTEGVSLFYTYFVGHSPCQHSLTSPSKRGTRSLINYPINWNLYHESQWRMRFSMCPERTTGGLGSLASQGMGVFSSFLCIFYLLFGFIICR